MSESKSDLGLTFSDWVDSRLEAMLAAPRMWGTSLESVELQVLTLLEARAFAQDPSRERRNPRRVLDDYVRLLGDRFASQPPGPLHKLVEEDESRFVEALRFLTESLRAQSPAPRTAFFAESHLGIELMFKPQSPPHAQAVANYYVEFCRATRALARASGPSSKTTGRVGKQIEAETDFELSDVAIVPRNGVPARARISLGAPFGQLDMVGGSQVKEALFQMLDLGERASQPDFSLSLGNSLSEKRQVQALVQTLRVLPRGDVAEVRIGGALVDRSVPVSFFPHHERSILKAVSKRTPPEEYDRTNEIRAIDLDRGSFSHGTSSSRVTCYLGSDVANSVSEVGVVARVTGQLYAPSKGKKFVIADKVVLKKSRP
jgi:hypothetical protein